jgi:hypothetical protein
MTAELAEDVIACVRAYIRQFVVQSGQDILLLRPTLDIEYHPHPARCTIHLGHKDTLGLEVHVAYFGVQTTGLFLADIVRCTLKTHALRYFNWAELRRLTALESLQSCTICEVHPDEANRVQEWADACARAGCAVGLVEITRRPQMGNREHTYVVWKPAECSLADAAWLHERSVSSWGSCEGESGGSNARYQGFMSR